MLYELNEQFIVNARSSLSCSWSCDISRSQNTLHTTQMWNLMRPYSVYSQALCVARLCVQPSARRMCVRRCAARFHVLPCAARLCVQPSAWRLCVRPCAAKFYVLPCADNLYVQPGSVYSLVQKVLCSRAQPGSMCSRVQPISNVRSD